MKSLREILTKERKILNKKITGKEAITILNNIDNNKIKKGINYIDLRCSGLSYPSIKGGKSQIPASEMIKYIERNFLNSEGKYNVFYNKKKETNNHKIELKRIIDISFPGEKYKKIYENSGLSPLKIVFSN